MEWNFAEWERGIAPAGTFNMKFYRTQQYGDKDKASMHVIQVFMRPQSPANLLYQEES